MYDLIKYIDSFKNLKIGVFGDLMLDEFTYGIVSRISPEAPVPILDVNYTEYRLGGCGNVASNLASFGTRVDLFGVVGDDPNRSVVSGLLTEQGIKNSAVTDKTRPTIRKNRIIAHKQQITRLDWESCRDISEEIENSVIAAAGDCIRDFDVIILSDYAKGFLTDKLCASLIAMANKAGMPIIVDPKAPFTKYKGSSALTPNLKEVQIYGSITAGSPADMFFPMQKIIRDYNLQRILVTLGENGMSLFSSAAYTHIKAVKDGMDIVDITGAGDTAIAVFSLALGSGASYEEAMQLANFASGVVVSKFGTSACGRKELENIINNFGDGNHDSDPS